MSSKKVLVSVVIPTFNRSNYLIKILNILRSNFLNFKNFEVLICDSFSKDQTKIKRSITVEASKELLFKYKFTCTDTENTYLYYCQLIYNIIEIKKKESE